MEHLPHGTLTTWMLPSCKRTTCHVTKAAWIERFIRSQKMTALSLEQNVQLRNVPENLDLSQNAPELNAPQVKPGRAGTISLENRHKPFCISVRPHVTSCHSPHMTSDHMTTSWHASRYRGRYLILLVNMKESNDPQILCCMPFLLQPSQFIWALDWHPCMLDTYPGAGWLGFNTDKLKLMKIMQWTPTTIHSPRIPL